MIAKREKVEQDKPGLLQSLGAKAAKLFGLKKLPKELTQPEIMALNLYTQERVKIYGHLNSNLRRSGSAGDYKDFLELFISGCTKLGPYADKTIYRGATLESHIMEKWTVGEVVWDKGIGSYSKDRRTAQEFAQPKPNCIQFIYTLKTKVPWLGIGWESQAHDLSALSAMSKEDEVVLLPDTKVEVLDRFWDGPWVHIHLKEV